MSEFPRFVRQRVAPVLEAVGYTGRGNTYRFLRDGGPQAVIDVSQQRRGLHDHEFVVGRGLLVREWIALIAWRNHREVSRPFEKADRGDGPFQSSLPDPEPDRMNPAGAWFLDEEDEDGIGRFQSMLRAEAERLAALTEPGAFEAELRAGIPSFPYAAVHMPAALFVLLHTSRGRFDQARAALEETEGSLVHDDLVAWVDLHAAGRHDG